MSATIRDGLSVPLDGAPVARAVTPTRAPVASAPVVSLAGVALVGRALRGPGS